MTQTIALISAVGGQFISNKPLFEKASANFIAITMKDSKLRNQKFVNEAILTDNLIADEFIDYIVSRTDIIEKLPEQVLLDFDDSMYQIAKSDLPQPLKRKLLPIKNPKFFDVAGSKVGQIRMFRELKIPHPKTQLDLDFANHQFHLPFPCVAKADRFGGGGRFSQILNNKSELEHFRIQHKKILIQTITEGMEFSVECFYRSGRLIYAQFGLMLDLLNGNGPSSRRQFFREIPTQVEENLRIIGNSLELDGLVNCTLFKENKTGEYLFFEFDVRLNSWAHVSSEFGLNVPNYFSKSPKCEELVIGEPTEFTEYIDPSRWLLYAKNDSHNSKIFALRFSLDLLRMKCSGSKLKQSHPPLAKSLLFEFLLPLRDLLPGNLFTLLDKIGLKRLIIKILLN